MKNHIRIDGKLLQTNKKWVHLKESQKVWIYKIAGEAYQKYLSEHKALPKSRKKGIIFESVYSKMQEKEIWIPYGEVKRVINKVIDKQNRKLNVISVDNQAAELQAQVANTNTKEQTD